MHRLVNWHTLYDRGDGSRDEIYTIPAMHITAATCVCPPVGSECPSVPYSKSIVMPWTQFNFYRQLGCNQRRLVEMVGLTALHTMKIMKRGTCPVHN